MFLTSLQMTHARVTDLIEKRVLGAARLMIPASVSDVDWTMRQKTIINTDLQCTCFSENTKIASVTPICKNESRSNKNQYRTASILNGFSKIYECFINDKLLNHVNDIFSDFVSAYRSKYNSNHMILRLSEEWKEKLDKAFFLPRQFSWIYLRCLTAYLTIY